MKYIFWSPTDHLVFPDTLTHAAVAAKHSDDAPLSAGFVRFRSDGSLEVFGESTSLNLKANPAHGRIMSIFMREREAA